MHRAQKLYYYTDWKVAGWAASEDDFRKRFNLRPDSRVFRVCAEGVAAPDGYRKTGELANCPAVRIALPPIHKVIY